MQCALDCGSVTFRSAGSAEAAWWPVEKVLPFWFEYEQPFFLLHTAKKYDAFLASESLIKQIPRILGPGLNKAGKFPSLLTHNENMVAKVDEVKSTIKFQMKKVGLGWGLHTLGSSSTAYLTRGGKCNVSSLQREPGLPPRY